MSSSLRFIAGADKSRHSRKSCKHMENRFVTRRTAFRRTLSDMHTCRQTGRQTDIHTYLHSSMHACMHACMHTYRSCSRHFSASVAQHVSVLAWSVGAGHRQKKQSHVSVFLPLAPNPPRLRRNLTKNSEEMDKSNWTRLSAKRLLSMSPVATPVTQHVTASGRHPFSAQEMQDLLPTFQNICR